MARLAVETKETYRTVQNWIGGDEPVATKIPAEFLAKVVEVTGVDPGWLLVGKVYSRTREARIRDAITLLRELSLAPHWPR